MISKIRTTSLLFLTFLMAASVFAQSGPGFREYDQTTWRMYQQKQWDSLIVTGKKAMAAGNDYQYLNARMGVAWFEKGNYRLASRFFNKALRLNKGDEFAREYLYYALLYSGRSGGAEAVAARFSEATRERLALKKPLRPSYVYTEMGPVIANAIDPFRDIHIGGADSIYGEFNLPGNAFYFHAGGGFNLGHFVTAYAGYSNLSLERYQRVELGTIDTVKRSYTFNQHQGYLSLSVEPVAGFRIVPSLHYISNKSRPVIATYNSDSARYLFKNTVLKNNNFATGLALYADWKLFSFSLHGNYANLMGYKQLGGGAAVTWFPSGNLNSWFRIHVTMLSEDDENRLITETSAGLRITPGIWTELSVAFGDMTRYVDENNFLIYNTDDKTTLRAQGVVYIPAFDNVMFSVRYIFNRAEGTTWHYDAGTTAMIAEKADYEKHTILGGIKWNF